MSNSTETISINTTADLPMPEPRLEDLQSLKDIQSFETPDIMHEAIDFFLDLSKKKRLLGDVASANGHLDTVMYVCKRLKDRL